MKINILLTSLVLTLALMVGQGYAADYSLREITPQVQAALDARKERFSRLNELKAKGIIGENNQGYVSALEENNAAEKLADAENQNRRVVYKAIATQNGLKGKIDIIEKVFAQIKREKANSGEMIQLETGDWIVKK